MNILKKKVARKFKINLNSLMKLFWCYIQQKSHDKLAYNT